MAFKIGFLADNREESTVKHGGGEEIVEATPKKSLVQVNFPKTGNTCTYYNDKFDLKVGDAVFVDGKLEGILGFVKSVSYTFKIKPSDYKKVIAVSDTEVKGSLNIAGSHFIAFDKSVINAEKIRTWFLPPISEEEEIIVSHGDESFPLNDLSGLKITKEIAERGHEYYVDNRVSYLSLDGSRGYAIVDGSKPYEVEFEYRDGMISNMVCTCFCNYTCKHEFAMLLQLKDLIDRIEENYKEEYERTNYFAAIFKPILLTYTVYRKETGVITF